MVSLDSRRVGLIIFGAREDRNIKYRMIQYDTPSNLLAVIYVVRILSTSLALDMIQNYHTDFRLPSNRVERGIQRIHRHL